MARNWVDDRRHVVDAVWEVARWGESIHNMLVDRGFGVDSSYTIYTCLPGVYRATILFKEPHSIRELRRALPGVSFDK